MKIKDKWIIEVIIDRETYYWNGSKPFVKDINKAFICPHTKSADKNITHIRSFYGYACYPKCLNIHI